MNDYILLHHDDASAITSPALPGEAAPPNGGAESIASPALPGEAAPPNGGAESIDAAGWAPYFAKLRASGVFSGGSSIGLGQCFRKAGEVQPITAHLVGYIRVQAESLEAARAFLAGNPVYEAGGTVEIRELPRD